MTVYVTRDGVTEKEVLQWSKELNKEGKLNNVNYVPNGLGNEHSHGYSYKIQLLVIPIIMVMGMGMVKDSGKEKSLSFPDLNLKVLSLFFKRLFYFLVIVYCIKP